MKFKQLFPTFESFHTYLLDYSVYYTSGEYTEVKALIYYTLLYRQFGNSELAYDYEVALEKLSLLIAENFREFFLIRKLLDYLAEMKVDEMLVGVESITNVADKINIETDADSIANFVGLQTRSKSRDNPADRIRAVITRLQIPEVAVEMRKYEDLFIKIIPRDKWIYEEDFLDDED